MRAQSRRLMYAMRRAGRSGWTGRAPAGNLPRVCTIIALFQLRQDFPLVLATNRDEFYARPTTGAVQLLSAPTTAVGGRDLQAGGTWMGVTARGFFVGVTNQRNFAARRDDVRSRGALVLDLLELGTTDAAKARVEGLDPARYNDFNLLFGDCTHMWVAYGRGDAGAMRLQPLPAGLHVLPNDELDSDEFPKCARAQALLEPHVSAPWPALRAALGRTLADGHTTPKAVPPQAPPVFDAEMMRSLTALCVRTPTYGTRSSTIVALRPGACAHYLYADGPPDGTPFADVTPLFHAP